MTGATRPDIPAVPTIAADAPAVTSPAPAPAGRPATATGPAGGVHRPGPRRMVSRQMAAPDCLSCGQRWPCEGSWQARAEAAEARLGELENAITWDTSCTSCARILDSAVAERERAEQAEARLAEIEAHTSAIVDSLRHTLSYVEHVPHPSSQAAAGRYRSALAITGTGEEEDVRGGAYDVWGADFGIVGGKA